MDTTEKRWRIFDELNQERVRQDARWGEQNHPMICGYWREAHALGDTHAGQRACEDLGVRPELEAKDACEVEFKNGRGTYTHIVVEELAEFIEACVRNGEGSDAARAELVQTAAVLVAMIECIDRKRAKGVA